MDVRQLYTYALDQSQAVALQVREEDLGKPTPDTEWTVRELAQHLLAEIAWIPDIMAGKTVAEVGSAHDGDLIGDDLAANWQRAVAAARQAVMQADLEATAHLSYTDKPIGEYLLESADDVLVHSWDLGQAIGVSVVFDEVVAQTLLDHTSKLLAESDGGGMFGERVDVPMAANAQTKLLALLGRSEDWAEAT